MRDGGRKANRGLLYYFVRVGSKVQSTSVPDFAGGHQIYACITRNMSILTDIMCLSGLSGIYERYRELRWRFSKDGNCNAVSQIAGNNRGIYPINPCKKIEACIVECSSVLRGRSPASFFIRYDEMSVVNSLAGARPIKIKLTHPGNPM